MKPRHTTASRRRRMFPLRRSKDADVILRDSFTDSNDTAIADHTPDRNSPGNAWVLVAGTFQIQSNKLTLITAATPTSAYIDLETANLDITVTLNLGDTTGFVILYILFRYLDNDNYWQFRYDGNNQRFMLVENTAGSFTTRGETAITIADDTDYSVRALAYNDFIKVVAHTGEYLTYTPTTHLSNTRIAIAGSYSGTATNLPDFDNLKVKRGLTE